MNLKRVRAMARKETWHLLRDPRSLALILLMPTMLLFLLGYAVRLDLYEAPIGLLQESPDATSNALAARFDASRAFAIEHNYQDRRVMARDIQSGEIWGALVVPHDFTLDLRRGEAALQFIADGVDANTARLMINFAQALVNDYLLQTSPSAPPIEIQDRFWFNEARESRLAIVPGVIAIVMAVIGALMTSLTIAREMEYGNLVMLRTTPLTRTEYLVGKLLPYVAIGMADVAVATATAVFIFDVPLRGSIIGLALVSLLFLLVVMLQGALISINAGNQLLASQISLVATFLPAFLLSGFIFAIDNMPVVLQYLTLLVPARYYVAMSKVIFLKGVSPLLLWTELLALVLILLALAAITVRRARKLGLLS